MFLVRIVGEGYLVAAVWSQAGWATALCIGLIALRFEIEDWRTQRA